MIHTVNWTVDQNLDVTPVSVQDAGVQGDALATTIVFTVPASLVSQEFGYSWHIEIVDSNGEYDKSPDITPAASGSNATISFVLPMRWTQAGGVADIRLVATTDSLTAYSFAGHIRFDGRQKAVRQIDSLIEGDIAQLMREAEALNERADDVLETAETAVTTAEESASRAEESATAAANSADAAAASESSAFVAESSATEAATSAASAAASANMYANAALGAKESAVSAANSAYESATDAAGWADSAKESAEDAADSESAAENAKILAMTAQDGAETAASTAESAAGSANTYAAGALAAKTAAEAAATAAATSASYSNHPPRISDDGYWELWNGTAYATSDKKAIGEDGVSAYEAAVEGGYVGTEQEFNAALAEVDMLDTLSQIVPTQASAQNQLADKDFVNSSVENVAAYYITRDAAGNPFNDKGQLNDATVFYSGGQVRTPTRNDYLVVLNDESKATVAAYQLFTSTSDYVGYYILTAPMPTIRMKVLVTDGNKELWGIVPGTTPAYTDIPTTRYIYGNGWQYQYTVNNSGLTDAQLKAINSGITAAIVALAETAVQNVKINGTSIVGAGGVVNIPYATADAVGVVRTNSTYGINGNPANGLISVQRATEADITARRNYRPIVPLDMDFALKAAMCDGTGSTWTESEKTAAKGRLGVESFTEAEITAIWIEVMT